MRVICFCTPGTASSGISTPRSPRATMIASDSSMIPSSCCSACGFSIFAMMPARPCTILRASAMSSGPLDEGERDPVDLRGERGVEVAPVLFGQRAGAEHRVGQAHALAVGELAAPARPRSRRGPSPTSVTFRRTRPSFRRIAWPGSSAARISGCGSCTRSRLPGRSSLSRTKVWPCFSSTDSAFERCRSGVSGPAGRRGCRSAGRVRLRCRG